MKYLFVILLSFSLISCNNGTSNPTHDQQTQPEAQPPSNGSPDTSNDGEALQAHQGLWGGAGIELVVSATSSSYQLDCAHGIMEGPFLINSQGVFRSTGTLTLEHGGPAHEGEILPTEATQYSGRITRDQNMQLVMDSVDSSHGTSRRIFALRQGVNGQLHRCL